MRQILQTKSIECHHSVAMYKIVKERHLSNLLPRQLRISNKLWTTLEVIAEAMVHKESKEIVVRVIENFS